jgi:hypothetical protein
MSQSQLQPPRLLEQMRAVLRARHYSLRTEGTYLGGSNASSCFMVNGIHVIWVSRRSSNF